MTLVLKRRELKFCRRKEKMTALSATNQNVIGEALTDVSSNVL